MKHKLPEAKNSDLKADKALSLSVCSAFTSQVTLNQLLKFFEPQFSPL